MNDDDSEASIGNPSELFKWPS